MYIKIKLVWVFMLVINTAFFAQTGPIADSLKPRSFYTEIGGDAKFYQLAFGNVGIVYHKKKVKPKFKENYTLLNKYINKKYKPNFDRYYISIASEDSGQIYAIYGGVKNTPTWKLLYRISTTDTVLPSSYTFATKKNDKQIGLSNTWVNAINKGWRNIYLLTKGATPNLNPIRNIDSLQQADLENNELKSTLKDSATEKDGLYYTILNQGSGAKVTITDTVTVFYKGYIFGTNKIFDQTETKPISFALNRLIKGWQIGIPLINVGGKIRLYLPSGMAYGIRSINNIIKPNSILVFDIELTEKK